MNIAPLLSARFAAKMQRRATRSVAPSFPEPTTLAENMIYPLIREAIPNVPRHFGITGRITNDFELEAKDGLENSVHCFRGQQAVWFLAVQLLMTHPGSPLNELVEDGTFSPQDVVDVMNTFVSDHLGGPDNLFHARH